MSLRNLTDRSAVLSAIEEYDRIGREAFLEKYQFGEAASYFLELDGKRYDSKAIVGAAHGYQHGTPLTPQQFSGGLSTVVQKLESLGFVVTKAGKTRGENWSKTEVANTVDDYFEMLQKDLRGQPYNKTDHRSHLITKLNGRTDGAIEMKHQNISAVLNEIGMTYIPGYKPRGIYQGVLADAVEEYLNQHPDFYNGTPTAALPSIKSTTRQPVVITLVLVDPPTPRPRLNPKSPPAFQPRHYDFVQRDAKNRDLGKAGEEFVIRFEKQRLVDEGRRELADRVEWVSKTRGDGAGYDVASFNADGSTRFIEVKTTNCGKEFPFILTENEITFSKLHAPNYYLYRVFDFARDPHFFIISGDLDQNLNLRPKTFEASFWL